jgi:hypothetical protein
MISAHCISVLGVGGLDGRAVDPAQLAGSLIDHIQLRVHHDADDADVLFAVGYAHSADDVVGIGVEYLVDLIDAVGLLHNNADDRDACVFAHSISFTCRKATIHYALRKFMLLTQHK